MENRAIYLKREWNRKEGRGNKDSKKGDKLGQGVGALERDGGWHPIMNYVHNYLYSNILIYVFYTTSQLTNLPNFAKLAK